ncbi:MAG: hypothetical protein A2762_02150 [Candidatus Lloydbacteria bacterium RIFCSPHIGHO2_01_FULL_54_11]|nr:MAG: hypothetical protein A2762_02150 [Candidatus Lloydbacteria bacterium RIFCSPHIGHO2_01_FULL_54_11]OGZ14265.1 MAG: hypothetical protein A2948_01595 [Candidatus Lloydbacteria bacterium RIFCSPLOWO2_01_FULL_54_18]
MSNHGNAIPAQYPEFAGMVQHKLWPALKDRLGEDEYKSLIAKPNEVTKRLREAFTKKDGNDIVVPTSPFFANEEVPSNYGYPSGYTVKPVCEQLVAFGKYFPNLDGREVLALSKELPPPPQGAEGWFVAPKRERVAKTENEAVEHVLDLIGKTRTLHNYRKGELGLKHIKLSERTAAALQMLGEKQKGDFLLIPAQFGLMHRGRSVRRVREVIANSSQFGLGSVIVGSMLLSHPERLVAWEQLHIDCPGDEYSPDADGKFSRAPVFRWRDGGVEFLTYGVGDVSAGYGAASAFLPQ